MMSVKRDPNTYFKDYAGILIQFMNIYSARVSLIFLRSFSQMILTQSS